MFGRTSCSVYMGMAVVFGIMIGRILPVAFLLFIVCLLSVLIGINVLLYR